VCTVRSEMMMEAIGGAFGILASNGDVILLSGTLGVGKTVFARGYIRAKLKIPSLRITSPSYLLDNAYQANEDGLIIHHMDLYRLQENMKENPNNKDTPLYMLGFPHVLHESSCLIEWPDRLPELPSKRIDVSISECSSDNEHGGRRKEFIHYRSLHIDASTLDPSHPWRIHVLPKISQIVKNHFPDMDNDIYDSLNEEENEGSER